jgi:ABC-type transporter Mla maintaining outer membrane lipid asymmetry ATPase subunit MlaF
VLKLWQKYMQIEENCGETVEKSVQFTAFSVQKNVKFKKRRHQDTNKS